MLSIFRQTNFVGKHLFLLKREKNRAFSRSRKSRINLVVCVVMTEIAKFRMLIRETTIKNHDVNKSFSSSLKLILKLRDAFFSQKSPEIWSRRVRFFGNFRSNFSLPSRYSLRSLRRKRLAHKSRCRCWCLRIAARSRFSCETSKSQTGRNVLNFWRNCFDMAEGRIQHFHISLFLFCSRISGSHRFLTLFSPTRYFTCCFGLWRNWNFQFFIFNQAFQLCTCLLCWCWLLNKSI